MLEIIQALDPAKRPLDNAAALQSLYAWALDLLQSARPREELEQGARHLAAAVGEWRRRESRDSLPGWYVGHLECLLGLFRSALSRRLPEGVEALLLRKQVPRLLEILLRGDRKLSDLALEAGLDTSYTEREISRMADLQVVRTAKHGRERWITITALGSSLAERIRQLPKRRVRKSPSETFDQLLDEVRRLADGQARLERAITPLDVTNASEPGVLPAVESTGESANDPWSNAIDRYLVGTRVSVKVLSLSDYGAFVELEPGIEGLIHVSEMSWSRRIKHPSKILNVGDSVEAMVLGVDPGARRISLGMKQVESNPWHELSKKYAIGTTITGKVRNLTEFGVFVEVEEGIDGLIHISDMSWSKRLKHPSEVLKKGDTVEAMVLNLDAENQRLSLGLKQLQTDVWDEFFSQHHVGEVVEGKVVRLTTFGAFVELANGIEGFVHVSEFGDRFDVQLDRISEMKIIKLIPSERRIGLSIRAMAVDERRAELETYGPVESDAPVKRYE